MTLDDLERRNSPNRSVISPKSVVFGTTHVHVRYVIARPPVCPSEPFVHPTQVVEIFGNVPTHLIRWSSVDI